MAMTKGKICTGRKNTNRYKSRLRRDKNKKKTFLQFVFKHIFVAWWLMLLLYSEKLLVLILAEIFSVWSLDVLPVGIWVFSSTLVSSHSPKICFID